MDTRHSVITFLSGLLFYCTTDVNGHEREITSCFSSQHGHWAFLTWSIPSLKRPIPGGFAEVRCLKPMALLLRSWPLLVRMHFGLYFPLLGSWLTFLILFPVPACFSMPGWPTECETVGLWMPGFSPMFWKGRTVGYWIAAMNEAPFSAFILREA